MDGECPAVGAVLIPGVGEVVMVGVCIYIAAKGVSNLIYYCQSSSSNNDDHDYNNNSTSESQSSTSASSPNNNKNNDKNKPQSSKDGSSKN